MTTSPPEAPDEDPPGGTRVEMHGESLDSSTFIARHDPAGDRDQATGQLLDYYQHTAQTADHHLTRDTRPGPPAATTAPAAAPELPDWASALAWMHTERANLLACIGYATTQTQPTRSIALTAALAAFLLQKGPWHQAATLHHHAATTAHHLGDRRGEADGPAGPGPRPLRNRRLPGRRRPAGAGPGHLPGPRQPHRRGRRHRHQRGLPGPGRAGPLQAAPDLPGLHPRPDDQGSPVDTSFATQNWQKIIRDRSRPGSFVRRHFEAMVFCNLADELRTGDVAVAGSEGYADWSAQLLSWQETEARLPAYLAEVGLRDEDDESPFGAAEFRAQLETVLTAATAAADSGYPENEDLFIDPDTGAPTLNRRKRDDPRASARRLEQAIRSRMPERSLLGITARTAYWVEWWRRFGPMSGNDPKLKCAIAP